MNIEIQELFHYIPSVILYIIRCIFNSKANERLSFGK